MSVDSLWNPPTRCGVPSPDTRDVSLPYVTLNGMDAYDPERDGELLPAREVCALLHIGRSTLPLWRERGELVAYRMRNGHWRYPSLQPTLAEARAALRGGAVTTP